MNKINLEDSIPTNELADGKTSRRHSHWLSILFAIIGSIGLLTPFITKAYADSDSFFFNLYFDHFGIICLSIIVCFIIGRIVAGYNNSSLGKWVNGLLIVVSILLGCWVMIAYLFFSGAYSIPRG